MYAVERDIFRFNLDRAGLGEAIGVLVWNLRWRLGYWIGCFTSARRTS